MPRVRVFGAGVAGLTCALALADAGCAVELVEHERDVGRGCSFVAGGMLAPWCEAEGAEPLIVALGTESLAFWQARVPVATMGGSLVVAPARDRAELTRFAARTGGHQTLDGGALGRLEPDLAGRFSSALLFAGEGHLAPRVATAALKAELASNPKVVLRLGCEATAEVADWTIDCRGLAARDRLPDLRGVKGEMAVLRTHEVTLARPVRLLHPRHPLYVVPRGDGLFMVGATTIENEERGRVTARALLELLGAAYALHPAFGEAEVVEMGCDLRPAFPDNLPRLVRDGRTLYLNGLYRHGFLIAPALARRVADVVTRGAHFPEIMHADHRERQTA